jgi:hypothetical protein
MGDTRQYAGSCCGSAYACWKRVRMCSSNVRGRSARSPAGPGRAFRGPGRPPRAERARAAPLLSSSGRSRHVGLVHTYLLSAPGCRAIRSTRSRERDPRRERRQLLVLRPGGPDLPPQLVDPVPQLVRGDAERRLALLPDRPLRDGDGVESARLSALQQRTLVEPSLRRMREGAPPGNVPTTTAHERTTAPSSVASRNVRSKAAAACSVAIRSAASTRAAAAAGSSARAAW